MVMQITPFNDAKDFDVQRKLVSLYEGQPFAAVMHQALTGVAGMWIYTAWPETEGALWDGMPIGAGILKTSEAVMPIGQEVQPLAWAISDMITHPRHRRQGVARALLRRMEGDAYRNGGRVLYLYTDAGNAGAIELYRTTGFERLADQSKQAVFVKLLGEPYGAHGR
jgi:ribosomal protein S18 acetylase RimI-like enzyme